MKKFLDPAEDGYRHPSSLYAPLEGYMEQASLASCQPYFFEEHFLPYEVGFSPLTLSMATYTDFKKACGHYALITSLLVAAQFKVMNVIMAEANTSLYE